MALDWGGMFSSLGQKGMETLEGVGEGVFAGIGSAIDQSLPGLLGLDSGAVPDTGTNAQGQTLVQPQNPTVTGQPAPVAVQPGRPGWVLPVAIGGGALALVAVFMMARK